MYAVSVAERVRPAITVEPYHTPLYPEGYAIVSSSVLCTYAGHWGVSGAPHAGMWVVPFNNERNALHAAERLRALGRAQ